MSLPFLLKYLKNGPYMLLKQIQLVADLDLILLIQCNKMI